MLRSLCWCYAKKGLAEITENKYGAYKGGGKTAFALMMSFGISLAIRIYLIGVLLGGWLDKHFGSSKGYITVAMVLVAIFFSIYMLYRDLLRLEKLKTEKDDGERDGEAH